MQAIRVHSVGEPGVMQLEQVDLPVVSAGTVRVQVEAIGVNFIDMYQRSGQYKMTVPFTPGQEAAGVVDTIGEGVTEFKQGDRVAYIGVPGAYAEYAVVPAQRLVHVPHGISSEQAAAVLLQGMTAHYLTHDTFPVQPGHFALVHAAAGGTGALLVQIAKRCGATVIGTVSTPEKAEIAREAGADHIILYTEQDFEAETKTLTGGVGVHVVYDSVGKDTFDKSLNVLRQRGSLILVGQSSGAVPPFDPQSLNPKGSLFLTRPTVGHHVTTRQELDLRSQYVFSGLASGWLKVRIDRTFPLAEAAAAHTVLSSRQTKGKVLLIP